MSNRGSSGCLTFLAIGCAVCVILAVGLAVGGYYLFKSKGPTLAAYVVTEATEAMLVDSGLSEEEKRGIREQISRATEKLKAGEIAITDVQRFAESMDQSPFVAIIALAGFEHGVLRPSGLSGEEKDTASRTIQRLQRALVERAMTPRDLKSLVDQFHSSEEEMDANQTSEMSDAEIRDMLADLKTKVDEAQIPDAAYNVDYVAETRNAVNLLLGEGTSGDVDSATP